VWSLFDGGFINTFGYNYTEHTNTNKAPDPATPEVNLGDRKRYDWRGVVQPVPGQVLMLGLQSERETLTTLATVFAPGTRAATTTKSGYMEVQTEMFQRFFFVANVRHDENDAFGPATTFRLAPAVILPFTETKLKATYGTGFKAPTLSQLYVSFPSFNFFANPNLRPEESKGYDYGFEQPFFYDRFRIGLTYFQNNITNLITANAAFTSWTNIGTAKTSGYEAFASAVITDRLKVRADYTYTKAIDAILDLELLRRPRHKYSVNVAWTPIDKLVFSATWLRVSDWIDGNRNFSIQRLVAPGYQVINLAANYTINDNVNIFTRIDNLLNEQYQNPTGFLRPGFGVYGGVRVSNW
jgi:vitamin B12 transporter